MDVEVPVEPVSTEPLSASTELEAVAALLKDTQAQPDVEPAEKPEKPEVPPEKWDLKSVAEKLQVDPAKLYELKLKASDGSEVSIGELKDGHKSRTDLDQLQQGLTKQRGEFEADRLRAERELRRLASGDPKAWDEVQNERLSRERESLLRKIPQWADSGVVVADRKAITDRLVEHGFPENIVDFVEDHRLFDFALSAVKDRKELLALKAAKAEAEKPKPKPAIVPKAAKPASEAVQFGRVKAAVTSGRLSSLSAVEQILKG